MSAKTCPNVLLLVDQRASRWSSQEDFCIRLTQTLVSNGAKCVVVYSSRPAAAIEKALVDAGAASYVVCQHELSLFRFCRRIRNLCCRHQIEVAHTHHYVPSSPCLAALALLLPCPLIVSDCAGGAGKPRTGLTRKLFHGFNRIMNGPIAGLVAPSCFVRERLFRSRGIPESKIWHISNGVDLDRFRRQDPSAVRSELHLSSRQDMILTAGNLLPLKAADVLLLAVARVFKQCSTVMLAVAGDGPERPKLEAHVQTLGIADRTQFLGERSDMPELLSASVMFCCPSVWGEAFGWVNAEAMACEVPVVATTTGAIPEVVEHGETGLLVPPGDPDAMAAAICELLASPERRELMGKAGRRRAEQLFDLRRTIERHIELYSEVAAKGSRRNSIVAF